MCCPYALGMGGRGGCVHVVFSMAAMAEAIKMEGSKNRMKDHHNKIKAQRRTSVLIDSDGADVSLHKGKAVEPLRKKVPPSRPPPISLRQRQPTWCATSAKHARQRLIRVGVTVVASD